jgi:hypothetical protein
MVILLDPFGRPHGKGAEPAAAPIITAPPQGHFPRSPGWAALLHDLLLENRKAGRGCWGCGPDRDAATGHHDKPFHLFPQLEMESSNVLLVCLLCHLALCHAGDWRLWVKAARVRLAANRRGMVKIRKDNAGV